MSQAVVNYYSTSNCIKQVALYARVSTEEQARHGLSIEAQLYNLREWAKTNGYLVVGEYVDPGISGKKPPSKRPALSRFFDDVEHGLEVDILAFTKLDRFFRSVKLYYQAVDVLDKHKIAWQAIHENYETVTSGGRLRVNLMLSIGEQEADRTGERIKDVFERKIANGECVSPRSVPRGLMVVNKHLVPSEEADAIRAAFAHYAMHGSIYATMDYLREEWGVTILYKSVWALLKNPIYIGEHRGNANFCEPLIERDLFDRVQQGLEKRSIRHNKTGRVYLFSGLIYCAECGRALSAKKAGNYSVYHCRRQAQNHQCFNRSTANEAKIEALLLDQIAPALDELLAAKKVTYKPKQKRKKPVNIASKLDRLKDLYVDGLIDKAQYLADREKLLQTLHDADNEPPRNDYAKVRQIISGDFRTRYAQLTRENKRAFWRAILDRVEWSASKEVRFFFRP